LIDERKRTFLLLEIFLVKFHPDLRFDFDLLLVQNNTFDFLVVNIVQWLERNQLAGFFFGCIGYIIKAMKR